MKTNDNDLEALSALMDGEVQDLELRRLLSSVGSDTELRTRWRRQHMVREVLQQRRLANTGIDVSAGVAEALSDRSSGGRSPIWSVAVAASVTLAVVMVGQQLLVPPDSVVTPFAVSELGGVVVPVGGAQPIQASLDSQSVPLQVQQSGLNNRRSVETGALYERLASDRYRKLSKRHSVASAPIYPAPYITHARAAELADKSLPDE